MGNLHSVHFVRDLLGGLHHGTLRDGGAGWIQCVMVSVVNKFAKIIWPKLQKNFQTLDNYLPLVNGRFNHKWPLCDFSLRSRIKLYAFSPILKENMDSWLHAFGSSKCFSSAKLNWIEIVDQMNPKWNDKVDLEKLDSFPSNKNSNQFHFLLFYFLGGRRRFQVFSFHPGMFLRYICAKEKNYFQWYYYFILNHLNKKRPWARRRTKS